MYIIGDNISAQISNLSSLQIAKSEAIAATRLHSDPVIAINMMKYNSAYSSTIHDIGYDRFFIHFWSNKQL